MVKRTEQKLRKMASSSNLRQGSFLIDKLFEMMNQEFKTHGTKCQVLQDFGICCRELGSSKLRVFVHACAVSALSMNRKSMKENRCTLRKNHKNYCKSKRRCNSENNQDIERCQ